MKPKLLYVDDEVLNLRGFKASYRRYFNIEVFSRTGDVLEYLEKNNDVDIVLADQKMFDQTGLELLIIIKNKYPEIKRFLFSGYFMNDLIKDALDTGIIHYFFTKPLNHVRFVEVMGRYFKLPSVKE